MKKIITGAIHSILILVSTVIVCPVAFSDDGTYDATVSTDSGTYSVPVEVEDGEVTQVHWPNGGDMSVSGADIDDGEAAGINSRGDAVNISIEDYKDKSNEEGE
jgi:hypothetical protein